MSSDNPHPPNSRLYGLDVAEYRLPDGTAVRYLRRRFIPAPESSQQLGTIVVEVRDRLDLLADRAYGDPSAGWRLLDANGALWPPDLLEEPGRQLALRAPSTGTSDGDA
jgi:hypothetical protein